jgi:hypothetical protein
VLKLFNGVWTLRIGIVHGAILPWVEGTIERKLRTGSCRALRAAGGGAEGYVGGKRFDQMAGELKA